MRLSAPIYKLKRQAKLLARKNKIPLHEALDHIAIKDGFRSWSHLSSLCSSPSVGKQILEKLQNGDMLLLGARPGHGKTLIGMELAALASLHGHTGAFFTLDYNEKDILNRFNSFSVDLKVASQSVIIETSDAICADYIIEKLAKNEGKKLVVIDYLQLLDQKRSNPDLESQVRRLKSQAKTMGWIIVIISQIDRSFELGRKLIPDLSDVRLPNPFNLNLFEKTCFLHEGEIQIKLAA